MKNKNRACFSVSGASYIRLRSGAWKRGISVARLVDKGINDALDRLESDLGVIKHDVYFRDITNASNKIYTTK